MAEDRIDKGLPTNVRTEVKLPTEEEETDVTVEDVTKREPVEVTP